METFIQLLKAILNPGKYWVNFGAVKALVFTFPTGFFSLSQMSPVPQPMAWLTPPVYHPAPVSSGFNLSGPARLVLRAGSVLDARGCSHQ